MAGYSLVDESLWFVQWPSQPIALCCSFLDNNIGIYSQSSNNLEISNNNVSRNIWAGLIFYSSTNNNIYENEISGNSIDIFLFESSKSNKIIKNNFIKNQKNAYSINWNKWGRNYWDDWKGINNSVFSYLPYSIPPRFLLNLDFNPVNKPYIMT